MNKLLFFAFLMISANLFSQKQTKNQYSYYENILKNIKPNEKADSWTLFYNVYARDKAVKSVGNADYLPQFKGFSLDPHEEGYYYIAYSKNGNISYVTDLEGLKSFVGSADNADEAALLAIASGYHIDFEFRDYAANYQDKGSFYIVEAGKVTSENCPFTKAHYEISVNKKTGEISQIKDLGQYFEIYGKECKNNPHHSEIDKQMEAAKLKAEEQKKIQKQMSDKMEKRIRKIQNKRR